MQNQKFSLFLARLFCSLSNRLCNHFKTYLLSINTTIIIRNILEQSTRTHIELINKNNFEKTYSDKANEIFFQLAIVAK